MEKGNPFATSKSLSGGDYLCARAKFKGHDTVPRRYGYVRVSLDEQRPDRQIDGLEEVCDELHIEYVSARSKQRPTYDGVIAKLQTGDVFVVWDLDRAFRSTIDAIIEANKLRNRGVDFQIVTMNIDTTTPAGQFVYTVLAALAEFERANLIKRTKEGMQAAKRRGKHIGRRHALTDAQIVSAQARLKEGRATHKDVARDLDVHPDTLRRALERYEAQRHE